MYVIDDNAHVIYDPDKQLAVRLGPTQYRIFKRLHDAGKHYVHKDTMMDHLRNENDDSLAVLVCSLRRAIKPFGLTICRHIYDVGWRLEPSR